MSDTTISDALSGAGRGAALGTAVMPGIGTAVGGLIGLASSLVPHIFGDSSQPALTAAAAAITGAQSEPAQVQALLTDPAAAEQFRLEALKVAAAEHIAERQAQIDLIRAQTADLQVRVGDVQNARQMAQAGRSNPASWGAPVTSLIITLGFFTAIAVLAFAPPQRDSGWAAMLNILVGALGAGFTSVYNFYLGSSSGSERKSELLAQSVPASMMPNPSAIVPAGDVQQN